MTKITKVIIAAVILIILIAGGFFAWRYLIKDETAECSPINFDGYGLVKLPSNYYFNTEASDSYEFNVDLNNDGQKELVRFYWDATNSADNFCEKVKPVMMKVFSNTGNCPKEVFSYSGTGNLIGKAGAFSNFWGDGVNTVMWEGISYACGSGSRLNLFFLAYRQGQYQIVEGPEIRGQGYMYKLAGESGLGRKIIAAEASWAPDYSDYCAGCAHRLQFAIYTWDGEKYIKSEAGITQNKYLEESIDEILQKEPSVLNLPETANWQTYTNNQYGFEIKYPKNWIVTTNFPGDIGRIVIGSEQPGGAGYPAIANEAAIEINPSPEIISEGRQEFKTGGEESNLIFITDTKILKNNEQTVSVSKDYWKDDLNTQQWDKILSLMVSTFKFIDIR